MKDSSVILMTLIHASSDSVVDESGEDSVQLSVPTGSISRLIYSQNDNRFNAALGGFGGLLLGGIAAKSIFDFNDNGSSIKGFVTVITCRVVGALIGYDHETMLPYSFPSQKKKYLFSFQQNKIIVLRTNIVQTEQCFFI